MSNKLFFLILVLLVTPLQGVDPKTHKVGKYDTILSVAKRHKITVKELVQQNNLTPPYVLKTGQMLVVTKGNGVVKTPTVPQIKPVLNPEVHTVAAKVVETTPKVEPITKAVATTPAPVSKPQVPALVNSTPKFVPAVATQAAKQAVAPTFAWPIKGPVISTFGDKKGKLRNEGINIKATRGATVKPCAAGRIIMAGKGPKAFGNIVMVDHGKGFMSAYCHLDRISVKKGQRVNATQTIGFVGKTGMVPTNQLHFELRRNGKSVDPLRYLK